ARDVERREDPPIQEAHVAVAGGRLELADREPGPGVLAQRDITGLRLTIGAAVNVGENLGQGGVCILVLVEGADRPSTTVGTRVAGLPAAGAGLADVAVRSAAAASSRLHTRRCARKARVSVYGGG